MKLNLQKYRYNKYSGNGNDGVIDFILKNINIRKGLFVEFGAWNGEYISNCRKLFKEKWSGIFIECDNSRYKELKKNYKNHKNIICLNKKIEINSKNNFDNIVEPYLQGRCIDFCSIDIDGLDLEVFETFEKYLPTVVCIESGFILPPYYKRVSSSISSKKVQQGLNVTVNSFEKKGYKIVCAGKNCFFVKKTYYHLFDISDDILTLYFDGLRAFPQYIPSIWRKLRKIDGFKKYRNQIALDIIKKTDYDLNKDSVHRRKVWANKNKNIIKKTIDKIELREKKKRDKEK